MTGTRWPFAMKPTSGSDTRSCLSAIGTFASWTTRASQVSIAASSGESMGVVGLREAAEYVKKRNLDRVELAEPEGLSGDQLHLIVEALDDAGRILLLGAEVVEEEVAMGLEHARLGLDGLDAAAHDHGAPMVEVLPRPGRGDVGPDVVEVLLEEVGARRLEVQTQQVSQAALLFRRQVAWALEQAPAGVLEGHWVALTTEFGGVLTARLVDGLVEVGDDVELVEDVDGLARVALDHLEVRFPHVAADHVQRVRAGLAEPREEGRDRRLRATLRHPEQAAAFGVDLVDEREELVPLAVGDLVDAQRPNAVEVPVLEPVGDDPRDRAVHAVPGGAEGARRLGPRQPPGPGGQEAHVDRGHRRVAHGPGKRLDVDAAPAAVHPARRVQQEDQQPPERHEVEPALALVVVGRPRSFALAADAAAVLAGKDPRLDAYAGLAPVRCEPDVGVNERLERVELVQYGSELELHRLSPRRCAFLVEGALPVSTCRCQLLSRPSAHPEHGAPAGGIRRPSPARTRSHRAQRRATERPEPPGAARRRCAEHGEDGEDATLPGASTVAPSPRDGRSVTRLRAPIVLPGEPFIHPSMRSSDPVLAVDMARRTLSSLSSV